jgi:NAD(P)-dependent dehydrogenase (short-subunit alcohol dehydrogenase family)
VTRGTSGRDVQVTVAAMPYLHEPRRRSATRELHNSVPYAVSKAAVTHVTRPRAAVVGPQARVNAVVLGLVDTPFTAGRDEARARVRRRNVTGDVGSSTVPCACADS